MSTTIHKTAIIEPNVIIGKNVKIYPYAVIGTRAEHRGYTDKPTQPVIIGDNCVIREFCTINAGTLSTTTLEDNVWMLRGSHVGHDAYIEHKVTLSCNALIGGHARVFQHTTIGLGATVHQRCAVPSFSILGMNAAFTKKTLIFPMGVFAGVPAQRIKDNKYLIDKMWNDIEYRECLREQELERIQEWLKKQL